MRFFSFVSVPVESSFRSGGAASSAPVCQGLHGEATRADARPPAAAGKRSPAGLRTASRQRAAVAFAAACFGAFAVSAADGGRSVEERVRALLAESHSGAEAATNTPQRVRVIEGRAAVFASTNTARDALAWLPAGAELTVRGELPDESVWVCVDPPESASVWIYRELVRDGAVAADKSRLRAGAGLSYRTVGSLAKGTRLEVRGSYGDWLRVKPPPGMDFWVLRDQVEPLAVLPDGGSVPESEAPPEAAAGAGAAVSDAPATNRVEVSAPQPIPAQPPPELAGCLLADIPGQGEPVLLTGVLDWGSVGGLAAPFCLVARQADGDSLPVCHVFAPAALAGPHVGARVALEGTRWQVKGAALPVLVVRSLRSLE